MQKLSEVSSGSQKSHWLDIVEALSVLGAIGGSAVSLVSQQVVFASIPLSLSVALNLLNRRRLLDLVRQNNQTAIAEVVQFSREHQTNLETLSGQMTEIQQLTHTLDKGTKELQSYTQSLSQEQKQIGEVVACLNELEHSAQAIRANPQNAKSYYNRGLTHQRLGDKQAAIADYTEAIQLHPSYAKAYYNRGLAESHVGDRQGAVEDLRTAAKFFFEQGDLANYQKARDLSKRLHDLSSDTSDEAPQELALEALFA